MKPSDAPEFIRRLVALAEIFDKSLSVSTQTLYFDAMSNYDFPEVMAALDQALATCRFFPRPSELREFANAGTEHDAEAAWMEYKHMARIYGGYSSPELPAALADTLVAVFGSWENACWVELSPEMWAAKRKEFDRVYRVVTNRGSRGRRELPGFHERENQLKGLESTDLATRDDENIH